MKKHILSIYGEVYKNNKMIDLGKTAYETTDADEFSVIGGTCETRSQESSDPDEFIFGSTNITKTAEATDVDEFILQGPTNLTFTQENTDEDEFLPNVLNSFNSKDFDEILLI